MAAKKSKILNIRIASKQIFLALLGIVVVSFLLSIDKIAEMVAPVLKMTPTKLAFLSDVVFTWSVSAVFFYLAFVTIGMPIVAILFAAVGAAIAYHALRKFD